MQFPRQRLSKEVVEKVEELLEKNNTYSQIAKQTGVSKASISKIKHLPKFRALKETYATIQIVLYYSTNISWKFT